MREEVRIVTSREQEANAIRRFKEIARQHGMSHAAFLKKLMDYGADAIDKQFTFVIPKE